jgi:hypothetical protein
VRSPFGFHELPRRVRRVVIAEMHRALAQSGFAGAQTSKAFEAKVVTARK